MLSDIVIITIIICYTIYEIHKLNVTIADKKRLILEKQIELEHSKRIPPPRREGESNDRS